MTISAYSTTAASNSAINGVNIAEGCAPGNLNDAVRNIMADIAAGPIVTGNGSASAPAHGFASDTDTGIYRVSANFLGVATGGTYRSGWDSTGTFLVGRATATAGTFSSTDTGAQLGPKFAWLANDVTGDSPLYVQQLNLDATRNFIVFGTSATVGSITTNGTTTAYNTSSDERLKENIADAGEAGALIDAIRVRAFDWKADSRHEPFGFIAQELHEVVPEAVKVGGDVDTNPWGVDPSKLVALLVKEVQSLRQRVAALEA